MRGGAPERFREMEGQLPGLLDALLGSCAYRRGARPAVPQMSGVYLFSESRAPMYVGRTRNANQRLGQHIWESSGQESAPFAFNIAKAEAKRAGLELIGSRSDIAAHPEFASFFAAAKQRVRAMDFRIVGIEDPALATVFEVYASIALGTEGGFNLFETH